jgi:hypothetical protein
MRRWQTTVAALAVAGLTVAGVFLGARSTSGGSGSVGAYEALLPRVLTPATDPTFGDESHEVATTYGLVASAAVAAGDDATANMAADWLIGDLGPGGWGTDWTWDPFGDGTFTPARTPMAITTALAINGLLDRGVDDSTAQAIRAVVLKWARDGWSSGFYWYSLDQHDAIYVANVSAMLAGVTARVLNERPELFDDAERALLEERVRLSLHKLGTGDAGFLRWRYSTRQDIVNDLNHHGYILWGAELARDAGFDIPWSRSDALRSLDEYDLVYPVDTTLTPAMAGRYGSAWQVSGTGTALALAARLGGDTGPWARKACVALERSPFYPRFAAHALLGFAWAGMTGSTSPPGAKGSGATGC